MDKDKVITSLYLNKEIYEELKYLANINHRSISNMASVLIEEKLNEYRLSDEEIDDLKRGT